jgi:hypothetical protein
MTALALAAAPALALPPALVQSIDEYTLDLPNARVLIGSDAHVWPGPYTTGMRSFLWAAKKLKPDVICLNGDTIDGATLSRFPRAGWDYRPTLRQEVQAAQAFLADVRKAAPKAQRFLIRGNHCQRVENAIANKLPEFEGMLGTRFEDLFPAWTVCWSLELPGTTIKHRWHNGQNAARQNTLKSGRHYVTGHLHSLGVQAVTDLNGTRFGIDTGTLADPYGPQFRYCEGAPRDHRSGWVFLTYQDGNLLWPEFGAVTEEKAGAFSFRGRIERVDAPKLH